MYDRTTRSLWNQLVGEPVIGPLADSGIRLDYFPVNLTTWKEWRDDHPDTTVLSLSTGLYPPDFYQPEEDAASAYFDYRQSKQTMFPVWQRDDRLNSKEQVIVVRVGGVHKAYPLKTLQRERVVNDSVNGTDVVVVAGSKTTLSAAIYARQGTTFRLPVGYVVSDPNGRPPKTLLDSDGWQWRVTEEALQNTADLSQTLPRLPSHEAYWFGWYAFHPDTRLYGE